MLKRSYISMLLMAIVLLLIPVLLGSQEQKAGRQLTGLCTATTGHAGAHGISSTQWLRATLGQPQPVGLAISRNYILEAGFWPTSRGQSVSTVDDLPPRFHKLDPVYPNPFNPATTIRFAVAEPGLVTIALFDLKGQRLRTLVQQSYQPGWYTVEWNGKNDQGQSLASGVYFCHLQIGDFKDVKKMTLLQ